MKLFSKPFTLAARFRLSPALSSMKFLRAQWLLAITSMFTLTACSSFPQQFDQLFNSEAEKLIVEQQTEDNSDSVVEVFGVTPIMHPEEEVLVDIPIQVQAPITNVWEKVADRLTFHVPDNRRIKVQRDWYLKHPKYMERVMRRARPFVYYIVEQIEDNQMPLELVLLPIVESAFDPFAYSHGRAAGMWQFIPGTAKRFGMKQTWWYDGRRDVVASTQGAIDYLKYLHKFFDGNWLHALAAYNSGEGRVKKAIRKNKKNGKPTDFWSLDLPRETRAYVPKLLALADILQNRDSYDFDWPSIDNNPAVQLVELDSQIDLAMAAEMAQMTTDELHALNSGFNRWATDPNGPHRLLLPVNKAPVFEKTLASTPQRDRLNWVRHKIKSGESLLKLAKKYHTTTQVIKNVNRLQSNVIVAGEFLMIPVAIRELDNYKLSSDARLAATQGKRRAKHKLTHKVTSGDTLWDISREYKVKLSSLAKWNGMAPTDPLMPGKTMVVWVNKLSDQHANDAIMRKVSYKVRQGDSLSRIASKFGIRTNDIVKWNQLNPQRYLQPGQKLTLHIDVTRSAG